MLPRQGVGIQFKETAINTTGSSATCTVAGVAGKTHYITDISATSDLNPATMQVLTGATVIWQGKFYGVIGSNHTFATPIWGDTGSPVSITVNAAAANACQSNIAGFTA